MPSKKRKSEELTESGKVKKLKKEEIPAALWQEIQAGNEEKSLINYVYTNPDCSEILSLISEDTFQQDNVLLCFLLLERILLLVASETTSTDSSHLKHIGSRLVNTLLSDHVTIISSCLSQQKPDQLTAASVRLITAIIIQGKQEALDVINKFDFGSSRLNNLPFRNRPLENGQDSVRTCYIKLSIALLITGSHKVIKQVISLKKLLPTLFQNLHKDPPDLIVTFVSITTDKIVSNTHLQRKDKCIVFNNRNIKHLVSLGCKSHDSHVTDVVFNLLKELSVHVAFQPYNVFDNYSRTNNPILLQLLLSLSSHYSHPLVPPLIKSVISSCPDLFHSFLKSTSFDTELTPTQKWLTQFNLLHSILNDFSYFEDVFSFFKDSFSFDSFLSFVCPTFLTRAILSSGVQSSCLVIKNSCLNVLNAILKRALRLHACIKDKLSSEGNTKWTQFCDILFSHLPDIQSIMTARHTAVQLLHGKTPSCNIPTDETDIIILNEELSKSTDILYSTVSILYHYQCLIPTSLCTITLPKLVTEVFRGINGTTVTTGLKSVLLMSVKIISNAPVDLISGCVKGEFLQCMLNLLQYDSLYNDVIKALVKCLRTYPHLYNYGQEMSFICRAMARHLHQLPLYTSSEREELMIFITEALGCVVQGSASKWFDITKYTCKLKDEQGQDCDKSVFICPLLLSFCDMFYKSPTNAKCLFLSSIIMKAVYHSSVPSVMALCLLNKLESEEIDHSKYMYLEPIITFLEVWSNREEIKKCSSRDNEEKIAISDISLCEDNIISLRDSLVQYLLSYSTNSSVLLYEEVVSLLTERGHCYEGMLLGLLEVLPIGMLLTNDLWDKEGYYSSLPVSIEEDSSSTVCTDICTRVEKKELMLIELLTSYNATLNEKDIKTLQLLYQIEEKSATSLLSQYNPLLWGTKGCQVYRERKGKNWLLWEQPTIQDVIALFSEKNLIASIRNFPYDRLLEPIDVHDVTENNDHLYDPCFVLPLISSLLHSSSAINASVNICQLLVKKSLLSYVIKATSSICPNMRRIAYQIFSKFNEILLKMTTICKEKAQLLLFMEVLANTVREPNARLPSIISSFFARSLQLLLTPDHFLFPVVCLQYLYEKPLIDTRQIPLYDSMIHSPQYKERLWMMELLEEGLINATPTDYQLYKRNEVLTDLKICYHSPLVSTDETLNRIMLLFNSNSTN